jgi:hypothetical protein
LQASPKLIPAEGTQHQNADLEPRLYPTNPLGYIASKMSFTMKVKCIKLVDTTDLQVAQASMQDIKSTKNEVT